MSDHGEPPPLSEIDEPWIWEAVDYQQNRIRIKVNWDSATGALMNAIVFRDPECLYTKILIGIGEDGVPDSTPHQWAVPDGETLIRGFALKQSGFETIYDILEHQITAGF